MDLWALTITGLCALIAVDFFIGRKPPHEVSTKEAGIWTIVWIVLAALFGLGLLVAGETQASGEFFAGYITEKSLSVDNLFVFVLIMAKFSVPSHLQQRVLLVGVLIAWCCGRSSSPPARRSSPTSRGSSTSSARS